MLSMPPSGTVVRSLWSSVSASISRRRTSTSRRHAAQCIGKDGKPFQPPLITVRRIIVSRKSQPPPIEGTAAKKTEDEIEG